MRLDDRKKFGREQQFPKNNNIKFEATGRECLSSLDKQYHLAFERLLTKCTRLFPNRILLPVSTTYHKKVLPHLSDRETRIYLSAVCHTVGYSSGLLYCVHSKYLLFWRRTNYFRMNVSGKRKLSRLVLFLFFSSTHLCSVKSKVLCVY